MGTGNGGTGDRSIHQFGFCKYLQKSYFLETEETLADDHVVIQEIDLKNLRSRTRLVIGRSASEGLAGPDGWLCTNTNA